MKQIQTGMSLIELMTVMVIVAILAAIAIPSYRGYMVRANRSEGKTALLFYSGALERCFTRYNSYRTAEGCSVTFPQTTESGRYQITAPTREQLSFTLEATPQGGQTADSGCGNLRIDHLNKRTVSGAKPVSECWGK